MDGIQLSVLRLREQGASVKEICRRTGLSNTKVVKILVTLGATVTDEYALQQQGLSIPEIAAKLEKSERAVANRLPYTKGMYMAEYPTVNALRIRKCKEKKKRSAENA